MVLKELLIKSMMQIRPSVHQYLIEIYGSVRAYYEVVLEKHCNITIHDDYIFVDYHYEPDTEEVLAEKLKTEIDISNGAFVGGDYHMDFILYKYPKRNKARQALKKLRHERFPKEKK